MKKNSLNYLMFFFVIITTSCSNFEQFDVDNGRNNSIEIIIKGSDTEKEMVQTLVNSFLSNNLDSKPIKVLGGGSSLGLESLLNNEVDVANSSRKISGEEYNLGLENGVNPLQVIVAVDAISIITNSRLGVDSLSMSQLKKIFNGTITNWKEIGGPDRQITIYGRDENSGTYHFVKENVLNSDFSKTMFNLSSTQEIIDKVKEDSTGIGYVGVGYLIDRNGKPRGDIWANYIYREGDIAYSPYDREAVKKGDYPLMRPLFQYYNGVPTGELMKFLQFELSFKGQKLIKEYGFFPLNAQHKRINLDQGINNSSYN